MKNIKEHILILERLSKKEEIDSCDNSKTTDCDNAKFDFDEICQYPIRHKDNLYCFLDEEDSDYKERIFEYEIESNNIKEEFEFQLKSYNDFFVEKLKGLAPSEKSSIKYISYYYYVMSIIAKEFSLNISELIKEAKASKNAVKSVYFLHLFDICFLDYKPIPSLVIERINSASKSLFRYIINYKGIDTYDAKSAFCFIYHILDEILERFDNNLVEQYYCYIVSGFLHNNKKYNIAIKYAKKGIQIDDIKMRCDAFNILGFCAISVNGQKQLAYDAYYSWFNKEPYGELDGMFSSFKDCKAEENWRKNNPRDIFLMHNNFAYVCASIGDTYPLNSKAYKKYYKFALKEIKASNYPEYFYTYGTILYALEQLDLAEEKYRLYLKESGISLKDELDVLENIISIITEKNIEIASNEINHKQIDSVLEKLYPLLHDYNEKIKGFSLEYIDKDEELAENFKNWNDRYSLPYKLFNHKKRKVKHIGVLLLIMRETVSCISNSLKRTDYSEIEYRSYEGKPCKREKNTPIVYYTSLKNATHLFDNLYKGAKEDRPRLAENEMELSNSINCLTLMHAKYMNDPNEGLPLLSNFYSKVLEVTKTCNIFIENDPEKLREKLYNENYVFLKAFTERVDTLDMWSLYGSDTSDKNDCDGCCVELDPITFEVVNSDDEGDDKKLSLGDNNFYLYRVVYLSKKGKMRPQMNTHIPKQNFKKIKKCYEALQEVLCMLQTAINDARISSKDDLLDEIQQYLFDCIKKCTFLFKDESYHQEHESRLLLIYGNEEKSSIRELKIDPPKICINPYFQIYIKDVMLGPNIKNANEWTPYLQYKLACLPELPKTYSYQKQRATISLSNIKYKK